MKKIFLISPVRFADEKTSIRVKAYVENLEKQGHKVHWPTRDTDQDDPIGLRICTDNTKAIMGADEIHIWWQWKEKKWWQRLMWWIKEKKSTGSLFDFGISFVLFVEYGKKIILANPENVKPTEKKSFNNVLLALYSTHTEGEKNER